MPSFNTAASVASWLEARMMSAWRCSFSTIVAWSAAVLLTAG
jgi:hypothetical protein